MDLIFSPTLLWFSVPLVIVLLYTFLQVALLAFGMTIEFETDADVDIDHDVDVDIDHDVDLHLDLDVEVDHDVDLEHGGGGHHSFSADLLRFLAPLGVGQVPLSVVAQAWALSWGVSGVAASFGLKAALGGVFLPWFPAATLPLATVGAWFGTQRLTRLVRGLFRVSGQAERMQDLVGRVGRVTSLKVDAEYGEVCLEVNGAPNYVYVKSRGESIERDSNVVVVEYDVDAHRIVVAPLEESTVSTSEKGAAHVGNAA